MPFGESFIWSKDDSTNPDWINLHSTEGNIMVYSFINTFQNSKKLWGKIKTQHSKHLAKCFKIYISISFFIYGGFVNATDFSAKFHMHLMFWVNIFEA